MQGKGVRHARQGSEASEACKSDIPNHIKKVNRKLPKLTVG